METQGISAEKTNDYLSIPSKHIKKRYVKNDIYGVVELFKVLGDSSRIKILHALFKNEFCVKDIAQILNLNQSSVSHQLKILKHLKLVRFRREGKNIFYSLDCLHVQTIMDMGINHIKQYNNINER
jgi:ArsR family transcriptional regulator